MTFSVALNVLVAASFCLSLTSLFGGFDTFSKRILVEMVAILLPPVICQHHVVAGWATLFPPWYDLALKSQVIESSF